MEEAQKYKLAKREGHIAIWGNLLLFIYKFWIGWLTGSVAIMADAWHTLSDSLSSILLVVGIKIAERPPDKEHPFGHGRAEVVVTLLIGVMLIAVGLDFAWQGIEQLWKPKTVTYGWLGITAMIVSITVKEGMAQYAYWLARRTGFSSLKADGHHHRSDAISSVIILVGIIIGGNCWWMDGVLSVAVALIILHAAWGVLRDAVNQLLGTSPDPELIEQVKKIAADAHGHDVQVHHLHIHTYGGHRELTFHIRFDGNCTLSEGHRWAHEIESTVESVLKCTATIHVEPIRTECDNICPITGSREE